MPHQSTTDTVTDQTTEAPEAASAPSRRLDRRTVIRTAGVVGAGAAGAGLLAACASSSAASSGSAAASSATSAATTEATTSASAAETSGAATSSAATPGGTPVKTADVPVGGGTILTDQKIVVTQPASGTFKAFSAVCTHMGCVVSSVDTAIDCMCHGSRFDLSTGAPTQGPATQALAAKTATVSGDSVYVE